MAERVQPRRWTIYVQISGTVSKQKVEVIEAEPVLNAVHRAIDKTHDDDACYAILRALLDQLSDTPRRNP